MGYCRDRPVKPPTVASKSSGPRRGLGCRLCHGSAKNNSRRTRRRTCHCQRRRHPRPGHPRGRQALFTPNQLPKHRRGGVAHGRSLASSVSTAERTRKAIFIPDWSCLAEKSATRSCATDIALSPYRSTSSLAARCMSASAIIQTDSVMVLWTCDNRVARCSVAHYSSANRRPYTFVVTSRQVFA